MEGKTKCNMGLAKVSVQRSADTFTHDYLFFKVFVSPSEARLNKVWLSASTFHFVAASRCGKIATIAEPQTVRRK